MTAAHIGVALSAALAFALPSPALAFARHVDTGFASVAGGDPPEGYLPALSAATGMLCVKQCPADDLPCDPPAFKRADGRCATQWR